MVWMDEGRENKEVLLSGKQISEGNWNKARVALWHYHCVYTVIKVDTTIKMLIKIILTDLWQMVS